MLLSLGSTCSGLFGFSSFTGICSPFSGCFQSLFRHFQESSLSAASLPDLDGLCRILKPWILYPESFFLNATRFTFFFSCRNHSRNHPLQESASFQRKTCPDFHTGIHRFCKILLSAPDSQAPPDTGRNRRAMPGTFSSRFKNSPPLRAYSLQVSRRICPPLPSGILLKNAL